MNYNYVMTMFVCFSHPESVQQNLKHDYLEHLYIFNSKNIEKNDCDL